MGKDYTETFAHSVVRNYSIWLAESKNKWQNGCAVSSVYGSKTSYWYQSTKLSYYTNTGKPIRNQHSND
jgi:hypothetical protein